MNETEIIAELRRSAVEDHTPWMCDCAAFSCACLWIVAGYCPFLFAAEDDDLRTFFLLVAHAMEEEA